MELLRLLPKVLRARDFHLYLENGKRLTDLWRFGGKALLGHKRPGLLRELKNSSERGLLAPLPHPAEKRFIKALGEFFPQKQFRLYLDSGSLASALEKAGIKSPPPLWRPFLAEARAPFIPVLPWPLGPEVLVLDENLDFPEGDLVPPALLAPATRALYDLASAIKAKTFPEYQKINKALKSSSWQRQGIYLTTEEGEYTALFNKFLEGGFLIPPSPREPAILPFHMSSGEESKLALLLK